MSNFLEKLQSSDEGTKRRVMIIASILIMAVVIYVWLAYFNNLLAGLSQPAENAAAAPQDSGFSFWQSTKSGAVFVYGALSDKLGALGDLFQRPREFIVEPPQ